MDDITLIRNEGAQMKLLFDKVIKVLPQFNITDPKILPYGLKPHTRSISWIAEQVIVQQAKYHSTSLGIDDVDFDMPDTCLHDCEIVIGNKTYHINIKVTNVNGKSKNNLNDIAAVEKLYMQYTTNPNYRLLYAVFGLVFDNTLITFVGEKLRIFSPQFLPIYVNPRNDKIQAKYYSDPEYRTREEFVELLRTKSKSIKLE